MEQIKEDAVTTVKENEVIEYDITDAAIIKMSGEFMPLKVKGPKDKEGYEKVHEARKFTAGKRIDLEKARKVKIQKAINFQRDANKEAKRITALLLPIENHLIAEEKIVTDEKRRLAAEIQKKAQEKQQARISSLNVLGVVFNINVITAMSDEDFQIFYEGAKTAYHEKLAEMAKEEIIKKQEAEKLETQRLEQERVAKEQAERETKIKAEQDRVAETQRLEQEKLQKERDKIEAEKRKLAEAEAEKKRQAELEQARKEAAEQAKREAEVERIEAEKKAKEEAERAERLKPDKDKLKALAESLGSFPLPEVKSKEAMDILADVVELIAKIQKYIKEKTKTL